jgi:hypothetical protein
MTKNKDKAELAEIEAQIAKIEAEIAEMRQPMRDAARRAWGELMPPPRVNGPED